jgi:hypothetical protein
VTTHPQRIVTATLGGHSGLRDWDDESAAMAEERASALLKEVPFRWLVARAPDGSERTEEQIRTASADVEAISDPRAIRGFYLGGFRALFSTTEETSAVRVPVLAVIGSRDAGVANVKRLPSLLPQIQIVIIDGATHMGETSATRRPEFVDAIRGFIAAHPSQGK